MVPAGPVTPVGPTGPVMAGEDTGEPGKPVAPVAPVAPCARLIFQYVVSGGAWLMWPRMHSYDDWSVYVTTSSTAYVAPELQAPRRTMSPPGGPVAQAMAMHRERRIAFRIGGGVSYTRASVLSLKPTG